MFFLKEDNKKETLALVKGKLRETLQIETTCLKEAQRKDKIIENKGRLICVKVSSSSTLNMEHSIKHQV